MQTDKNDEEPAPEPAQLGFLRRLEQRHGLSAMVALATFAALLVGLLAAIPDWREMLAGEDPPPAAVVSPVPPPSPAPVAEGLSAIDLVVRDPEKTGEPDDYEAPWTSPTVEITVHNRGTRRSVITRVVVTIEDSAVINICDTQGGALAVSATYDLTLPLQPAAGTVLRVPVSQQQASDEADRFALKVGTPERENPFTIHVYRLRFELEAGGEKALPAGTAVVAVPADPGRRRRLLLERDI